MYDNLWSNKSYKKNIFIGIVFRDVPSIYLKKMVGLSNLDLLYKMGGIILPSRNTSFLRTT